MKTAPHFRTAQKALAREVVILVHGEEAFKQALRITNTLFSGNIKDLNSKDIGIGFKDVPSLEVKEDINIVDALANVRAAVSKREAREFVKNGAVSINGDIIKDIEYILSKGNAIDEQFTVIRRGKKNYFLIKH